ncbi:unnamed protein product [Symbiodinium natans]|uniref:Uncharacterized protein n=1 Tax=Symbiodinium natans TaxID=878477 RepID=A0A812SW56_9DINO|nr:unnamed protein product [Symbiodinium natans]
MAAIPAAAEASPKAARGCHGFRQSAAKTPHPTKLQSDLTVKLRAMDLALEQIEPTREAPERSHSQDKPTDAIVSLVEETVTKIATSQIETFEVDISQMHEECKQSLQQTERKMSEFQVELTTALEQHLSDSERLLDKRVQDVRIELLQSLAAIDTVTKENGACISRLDNQTQTRLDQMEASVSSVASECLHLKESVQLCVAHDDFRSQYGSLDTKFQRLEEDAQFSQEQLQSCR